MNKRKQQQKVQLCWDCENAYASKCKWVRAGIPIEGWDAEETEIKNSYGENEEDITTIPSFHVKSCPNYIMDKRTTKPKEPKQNKKHKCLGCGKIIKSKKKCCNNTCYYRYYAKIKKAEVNNG